MSNKKYGFTGVTKVNSYGVKLRQIYHLTSKQEGGWIETEYNLSHEGSCWVDLGGEVWGNGRDYAGGIVPDYSKHLITRVQGDVIVGNNCRVFGGAQISGEYTLVSRGGPPTCLRGPEVNLCSGWGDILGSCSMSPVIIGGFCYRILICDDLVAVGCKAKTLADWLKIDPLTEFEKLREHRFYNQMRGVIKRAAVQHQRNVRKNKAQYYEGVWEEHMEIKSEQQPVKSEGDN